MAEVGDTSRVDELKRELFSLQEQRKKIEDELTMHKIVLENNKVGMNDKLVDEEGFPRNDIDVYNVRLARVAIIKLENDGKDLFNRMQAKLEELHSLTRQSN